MWDEFDMEYEPLANCSLDAPIELDAETAGKILQPKRNIYADNKSVNQKRHECLICGSVYFDRGNKLYCSSICCKRGYRFRKLARTTAGKVREYEDRKCVICGRTFHPHTDYQATCGGECSAVFMWRKYGRLIPIHASYADRR